MRLHVILRYIGFVFLFNALFLLISSIISLFNSDTAFRPLLYSSLVIALFGAFPLIYVPKTQHISNNEGLAIVVSSWLSSCLIGTIPYVLWGGQFNFTNAWFESVSGFTTTGSSILTNIEALPMGLLFWRSSTHWIGGMGIIIFVLSLLPFLGPIGMVLFRSEMPSIARINFKYNLKNTLKIILFVYIGLTILETISLSLCGMNIFDAVTHSFATIATGGFSPKNLSIAHYDSITIETVIIIFMILSGIHFGLLFSTIFENYKSFFKSTVVKYYLLALCIGVIITFIDLNGNQFKDVTEAFRYSIFQIVSVGTSTGFANTDSAIWPNLSQLMILFFSLQCACAGSTSGGIKVDRIVTFGKTIGKQIKSIMHPRAIIPVKIEGKNIQDNLLAMTLLYIILYLSLVFVSTLLLSIFGVDMLSAFSGSVAATGNVGPGLGTVGSMSNYHHIPDSGKWILSFNMLLGRLEIYGLIIFCLPNTWKLKT